jgi:hypothetical protein
MCAPRPVNASVAYVCRRFVCALRIELKPLVCAQESVDTPLVERRKNWLQRQITRMGSVRSSSTTYSSSGAGGFFSRNRHNSVYSSPETTQPGNAASQTQNNPSFKISLYDRLRRKSIQSQRMGRQGNNVVWTKPRVGWWGEAHLLEGSGESSRSLGLITSARLICLPLRLVIAFGGQGKS